MATLQRNLTADWYSGPCYLPGQQAPAGRYFEIDTHREVLLQQPDVLPASCDGHVAVYIPRPKTWEELATVRTDN